MVAVAAATALTLAGCSSSSGGKKAEEEAGNVSAGKADTPRLTIAMITHAPSGDTFWDTVRKGAEAAAAKDNVKLIYSERPRPPATRPTWCRTRSTRRSTASPSPWPSRTP